MQELELRPVDPSSLGRLVKGRDLCEPLSASIDSKIQLEPETGSYPDYFKEFTSQHLERYANHCLLVLPDATEIDGDLDLDFSAQWLKPERLAGLVCEGDLSVKGDIYNRNFSFGPLLFVSGSLHVGNLIKAGAPVMVLGDLTASGIVLAEYNDGVMRVGGDLEAQAYFLFDHDGYVRGTVRAPSFSSDDDVWREVLLDDVFQNERDDDPDVTLLWRRARKGLPLVCGV